MKARTARGLAAGGLVAGLAVALSFCPSAIAQIYWANQGTDTIGRADLDGLNPNPSFVTGATDPTGVAIDAAHVYWSHAGGVSGSIGRAELDGTTDKNQAFIATASPPGGVTLDAARVYWTHVVSPGNGRVGRARLSGSSPNPSYVPTGSLPCGVAVDADNVFWANTGNPGTIGSSHGAADPEQDFITAQQDPCGVAIDGTYVYWANRAGETIGRANLDGSNVDPDFIATGTGSVPCGVAVGGSHVYWSDQAGDKIGRADLDGSNPAPSFIDTGAGSDPCGVAVIPTVAVSPASHAFAETAVGGLSDIQAFFVANPNSSVLDVSGVSLTGPNPGDFELTGDSCAINIAPAGNGCLINARFSPTAPGVRAATLRITSNASNPPTDVPLTGTATTPVSPPAPEADTEAPDTTLAKGPSGKTRKRTAVFEFSSSESGSSFECKLDDGGFEPCSSPRHYTVGKGKHSFAVRATDAAGNTDPTPATRSWSVKKKKKQNK